MIETDPVDGCFFRPLESPLASITWEITNRCSLHCVHCCTEARETGLPDELTTAEAKRTLDYFHSRWGVREIYFSGGEPFEREDFLDLCEYAGGKGVSLCVASSGLTVTTETALRLSKLPVEFVHISIDSAEAAAHDEFRRYQGSFTAALRAVDALVKCGVEVRVGTVVSNLNVGRLDAVAELCARHGVRRLCFIVMLDAGRARRSHKTGMLLHDDTRNSAQVEIEEVAARFAGRVAVDCRRTRSTATAPLAKCPGSYRLFHIDATGVIWPCSWIAKLIPEFRLGNARASEPVVDRHVEAYRRFLDSRNESVECSSCDVSNGCGRGCPIAALLFSADAKRRDPLCVRPASADAGQISVGPVKPKLDLVHIELGLKEAPETASSNVKW